MVTLGTRVAKLEKQVAMALYESSDTAISLSCAILLRYEEYEQLLTKRIQPSDYIDRRKFALDWNSVHILSKSTALSYHNPDIPAKVKYLEAEAACKEYNASFWSRMNDPAFSSVMYSIKDKVSNILGRLTQNKLHYFENKCRFGPGSTTSRSSLSTYADKLHPDNSHVSPDCLPYALFALPHMWRAERPEFVLTRSAKGCIVPKNAKASRCIEIQPDLNIYFQLGAGALLRRQLLWSGIDLSDQGRNRYLAYKGSVSNDLATIDLSSASDTISYSLVAFLLPPDWRTLLEDLRTTHVTWPEGEIQLEKWSAMGNGYTFELETLIFYAACLHAAEVTESSLEDISVYGDDIIVPVSMLDEVKRVIHLCGFRVNPEKTFGEGLFRESCGHDYFDGLNVRPFFLKGKTDGESTFSEICWSYGNAITDWSRRICGGFGRDSVALPSWLRCFTSCPEEERYRIPMGFGGGFISNFDEATPKPARRERGWSGYLFRYGVRPSLKRNGASTNRLVYASSLMGQSHKEEFISYETLPRRKVRSVVSRTGYALSWPDLGSWV